MDLRWRSRGILQRSGHIVGVHDGELEEMNLGYEECAGSGIHAERLREAQNVRSMKRKLRLSGELQSGSQVQAT